MVPKKKKESSEGGEHPIIREIKLRVWVNLGGGGGGKKGLEITPGTGAQPAQHKKRMSPCCSMRDPSKKTRAKWFRAKMHGIKGGVKNLRGCRGNRSRERRCELRNDGEAAHAQIN